MRITGGHLRWSIHSNWVVSEEMLKLHRGEPFALVNAEAAKARGIAEHDYIRVFNDYGSFIVRAKLSPCTRPDQIVIYHAWEPYQYPNWMPQDGILPCVWRITDFPRISNSPHRWPETTADRCNLSEWLAAAPDLLGMTLA